MFHGEQSIISIESSLSAELYKQHIDISWRNTRYARRLTYGFRANAREFLARLDCQRVHSAIVKIGRNGYLLEAMHLLSIVFLALYIATIFDLNLSLLDNFIAKFILLNKRF